MANRIIFFAFVVSVFASCNNRPVYFYTEIDNPELVNQISIYGNYIDSIDPRSEKLISVVYKKVNDTTVLFDLAYMKLFEPKDSFKKEISFTFVGIVNNRDVLFFDNASESGVMSRIPYHFFKFKSDAIASELVDRNFRQDFKNINQDNKVEVNFDPCHFHLTFINGRLVKKNIGLGQMFF